MCYHYTKEAWWVRQASNLRPPDLQSGALPSELHTREKNMAVAVGIEPTRNGLEPSPPSLGTFAT